MCRFNINACVTYPSFVPVIHVAESLVSTASGCAEMRAYKAETVTQVSALTLSASYLQWYVFAVPIIKVVPFLVNTHFLKHKHTIITEDLFILLVVPHRIAAWPAQ